MTIPTTDTVIHATPETRNLLIAFADALELYGDHSNGNLVEQGRALAAALRRPSVASETMTTANDVLNDLYDTLDAIAGRHGLCFGVLTGSDNDFGFWRQDKRQNESRKGPGPGGAPTHAFPKGKARQPKTLNLARFLSVKDYQKLSAMQQPGETDSETVIRLVRELDLAPRVIPNVTQLIRQHVPLRICMKSARRRFRRRHGREITD